MLSSLGSNFLLQDVDFLSSIGFPSLHDFKFPTFAIPESANLVQSFDEFLRRKIQQLDGANKVIASSVEIWADRVETELKQSLSKVIPPYDPPTVNIERFRASSEIVKEKLKSRMRNLLQSMESNFASFADLLENSSE